MRLPYARALRGKSSQTRMATVNYAICLLLVKVRLDKEQQEPEG